MRSDLRTALALVAALVLVAASASIAVADETAPADAVVVESTAAATAEPEPTAPTPEPEPTATTEPTPTPTPTPTETTTPDVPEGATAIEDAQLRWGFNAESNRAAFAPGTFNFFSAGKIADPGRGGVALTESGWKATSGDVHIEKYDAATKAWRGATWSGVSTDSNGDRLSTGSSTNSNHQVVIDGGTGSVDPDARTATVQWKGSFTVLYYSGYSFFYVTDPRLTVTRGVGTLTATLSGYGSSMEDMTQWVEIDPVEDVVLANLGTVDLTSERGFTATPTYKGVKVSLPSDQVPQLTFGTSWGSFPQSFIDYQVSSGSGSYWYSSGGSADAHKVASALSVSYDADLPVKVTPPPTTNRSDTVTNDAVAPPTRTTTVGAPGFTPPPVATAPTSSDVLATSDLTQVRPLATVIGAAPAEASSRTDTTPLWIAGSILLALAALVAASPFAYAATTRRR